MYFVLCIPARTTFTSRTVLMHNITIIIIFKRWHTVPVPYHTIAYHLTHCFTAASRQINNHVQIRWHVLSMYVCVGRWTEKIIQSAYN
jgi:hypothetical protein